MNSSRNYRMLVFFSAFACLMFELIISRLADFHLGAQNSFLALPITFFGLALGSLHVHFRRNIIERFQVGRNLLFLAGVCLFTQLAIFVLFTRYLPPVSAHEYNQYLRNMFWKTLTFAGVFIIPFYVFGRILTVCYHLGREQIGRIYSADFFGAAAGCFLVPVLFHFVSLPEITTLLLATIVVVVLVHFHHSRLKTFLSFLAAAGVLAGFYTCIDYLDHGTRYAEDKRPANAPLSHEVLSRWNEFSRVQLIHYQPQNGSEDFYKIIHDNFRSNVHVAPYIPGKKATPTIIDALEIPFILDRKSDDILVMFAGCGAEMTRFNEYTAGKASIVGVEINGLCKEIARNTPELADYRLGEFYDLPNIDLEIAEGRSFLMRNTRKYDIIFVGSSAPTSIAVTGHTRKFLYTIEAFNLYLDALKPGGLLIFDHQPMYKNLDTLKIVFEQRGLKNFSDCVLLVASMFGRYNGASPDLVFSPDGFTREEVIRLLKFKSNAPKMIRYAPFRKDIAEGPYFKQIHAPIDPQADRVTDDFPYILSLDLEGYSPWLDIKKVSNETYYVSWIKITTVLVACLAALIFILTASFSRAHRVPPSVLIYLLVTGFCYLLIEVAYIAKLELFLQDPLISMACVISIFLLTSGIGSLSYSRVAGRMGMLLFPLFVAALVALSMKELDYASHHLLGLPVLLKLLAAAFMIGPVGILLGMFYPYAVSRLVKHEKQNAVAVTYGISTLASVIGATYAMTFMLRFGFNALLLQATVGYVVLFLLVAAYSLLSKKNLLA